MDDILSISSCLDLESPISEKIWIKLIESIKDAYIPRYEDGFNRRIEEKDVSNFCSITEKKLENIANILEKISTNFVNESLDNIYFQKYIISLIILISEHNDISFWTNENIMHLCNCIKISLFKIADVNNLIDILFVSNKQSKINGIFSEIMLELRPKLVKNSWKEFPGGIKSFEFLLFESKFPYLGSHIQGILPFCLILIDDFVLENRLLGIQCLTYLMENVTKTELNWLDQDKVIYAALELMLYERKKKLIKPLFKALIIILKQLEDGYTEEDKNIKWSRYDDCFYKIIEAIELEQNNDTHHIYLECLVDFMYAMKQSLIRWNSRFLKLIKDNLEVETYCKNFKKLSLIINLLYIYLKFSWPILQYNYEKLIMILTKFIYDISIFEEENEEIIKNIVKILEMIIECVPETLDLLKEIKENCKLNKNTMNVLNKVI